MTERERVLQSQLDSIIDRQLENENLKAGIANAEERERVLRKFVEKLAKEVEVFDGACEWDHREEFQRIGVEARAALKEAGE